jgi:hypothetical protein
MPALGKVHLRHGRVRGFACAMMLVKVVLQKKFVSRSDEPRQFVGMASL